MSTFIIDAFEFSRQQERSAGRIPFEDLPRLAKESPGATGSLDWSLTGGTNKFGHPQLTLSVSAMVGPICQRCLSPFSLTISSESFLVLAKDEADADRIQEMLDDEDVEVIVGSREMNLLHLIEDEALLALPLSPRHDVCPETNGTQAQMSGKPSPFAVLKDLKK